MQNASIEPVFLAFKHNQEIIKERIKHIIESNEPYGDVTCDDGVRHVLWKCSVDDAAFFTAEFEKIPCTYVADGHHRTAAAYNVGKMRREQILAAGQQVTGEEAFNFFMALHFPADNLMIMDYNRVLKELNGMNNDQFLERLGEHFEITPIEVLDTKPKNIHTLSLFLNQTWFNLALKPTSLDTSSPVTVIDSHMLTELVLKPMLGIEDIKKDPRIDFVGGIRGHQELVKRCNEDCVAAFAMFPV